MNQPTPAIVAQSAVRRLPRLALLLFCAAYVMPGLLGRGPWKSADIDGLRLHGRTGAARASPRWLDPMLLGLPPEIDAPAALLAGRLGDAARAGLAARPTSPCASPFALLLVLTFTATWYARLLPGAHARARSRWPSPSAARRGPTDYARAIADGGLLALIACLGLAQLGHETTPALAQLCFTALAFYGVAALPYRALRPGARRCWSACVGLALSGAPSDGAAARRSAARRCIGDRRRRRRTTERRRAPATARRGLR